MEHFSNHSAFCWVVLFVGGDYAVLPLNKIFADFIAPTDVQTSAADINLDGSVTDDDLSILMQFLIGIRSDLTDVD